MDKERKQHNIRTNRDARQLSFNSVVLFMYFNSNQIFIILKERT